MTGHYHSRNNIDFGMYLGETRQQDTFCLVRITFLLTQIFEKPYKAWHFRFKTQNSVTSVPVFILTDDDGTSVYFSDCSRKTLLIPHMISKLLFSMGYHRGSVSGTVSS